MIKHLHLTCLKIVQNRTTNNKTKKQRPSQQSYYENNNTTTTMNIDDDDNTTQAASSSMMTEEPSESSSSQMFSVVSTTSSSMNSENSTSSSCRKGVQFRSRDSIEDVRRISRISNRSLDEVIAYWGTTDEHKLRKQELRSAAHDMQINRRMSDNMEFTTLGLADKVGEGKALKKAHRAQSREAVLDEQELQCHEGIVDDELLADVYSSVTYGPQRDAQTKAELLHNEVQKFSSSTSQR